MNIRPHFPYLPVTGKPFLFKIGKVVFLDGLAGVDNQCMQKMEVVVTGQHGTENLLGFEEVPEVRAAVVPADFAGAL